MRPQDLEHRLHVLYAAKDWEAVSIPEPQKGSIYRAMLDGAGITIRALCENVGIEGKFKGFYNKSYPHQNTARYDALLSCIKGGQAIVAQLQETERHPFLEVLFFANRAVSHPKDGDDLDHKADLKDILSARETIIKLIQKSNALKALVPSVNPKFLK